MSQSTIYVRYIILFMQWSFGMKVCAYFRLICCWLICLDLMGTVSSVQWCSGYHARFTRERSWVRPPVEPGNVFLRRTKLLRDWQRNLHMHTDGSWLRTSTVVVAEWLRRWTRNPLGSSRAGSNPADNATFCYQCFLLIIVCSALLIVFGMDKVISINKNNKISTPTRFELAIFWSEVRRLIH